MTGVVLACSGAYAWWVGTTTPFTTQADVTVAVGFAAMALVAGRSWPRSTTPSAAKSADVGIAQGGGAGGGMPQGESAGLGVRRWAPWLVAIGLVVALELGTYFAGFSGGRHAFPTLSSLSDTVERSTGGQAVLAWLWLVLGWGLFHR